MVPIYSGNSSYYWFTFVTDLNRFKSVFNYDTIQIFVPVSLSIKEKRKNLNEARNNKVDELINL